MYFHVMIGANDIEASRAFYDATFAALGVPALGKFRETPAAYMYDDRANGLFFVTMPQNGEAATAANGGTIMFKAKSSAEIDAWAKAAAENGGTILDAPGPGPRPGIYVSRLRDPAGNKLGAICFG